MDPDVQPTPREITIAINPKAILKWLSFIVLLAGVFFLGRFSADFGDTPTVNVVAVEEPEVVELAEEVVEEPEVEEVVEEVAAEPEPEPEPVVSEEVLTVYTSKVTIGVEDLDVKWFGTWGKVNSFTLVIKNEEKGTIEPASMIMLMEGYNDIEKEVYFDLPSVKSGETLMAAAEVRGGFSYHPKTVGNLEKVRVQLILRDAAGMIIRGWSEELNLPGE